MSNTTGLTPTVSRISLHTPDPSQLYDKINTMLQHNLIASATHFAEILHHMTQSTCHGVLFARCLYLGDEKRRCLGMLEQLGYLNAASIQQLRDGPSNTNTFTRSDDIISAVLLAAQCLFDVEQYEDCVTLLDPLLGNDKQQHHSNKLNTIGSSLKLGALVFLLGKCFEALDNKPRAVKLFLRTLQIDPFLVEAVDFLVTKHLLTHKERLILLLELETALKDTDSAWLLSHYSFVLNDAEVDLPTTNSNTSAIESQTMIIQAERLYTHFSDERACRLARKAYSLDPYNWRGLGIYVACLTVLEYKTELFYLGHELVDTYPKQSLTWYTVGCYYWCCKKLDLAQKFFQRATKIDKKFSRGWLALGIVLSAQEETEHSLSAFRTACRLLPGLQTPMFLLAKELSRTSNYSLALQVLHGALEYHQDDVLVLNELGVVYMHQQQLGQANKYLSIATNIVIKSRLYNSPYDYVILNNYATCLRRTGNYADALEWYHQSLSSNPGDASTHANIAFTQHLMRNLSGAIESYHRALSMQPSLSFCSEMLTQALEDSAENLWHHEEDGVISDDVSHVDDSINSYTSADMFSMEEILSPVSSTNNSRTFDGTMST